MSEVGGDLLDVWLEDRLRSYADFRQLRRGLKPRVDAAILTEADSCTPNAPRSSWWVRLRS